MLQKGGAQLNSKIYQASISIASNLIIWVIFSILLVVLLHFIAGTPLYQAIIASFIVIESYYFIIWISDKIQNKWLSHAIQLIIPGLFVFLLALI